MGDLRNDIVRLDEPDSVTHRYVQTGDLIPVVQQRVLHGCASDLHRLKVGGWYQCPGVTHAYRIVQEPCRRALRVEFPGNLPLGTIRRNPQWLLLGEVFELEDDAVNPERQLVPSGSNLLEVGDGFFQRGAPAVRNDVESELLQPPDLVAFGPQGLRSGRLIVDIEGESRQAFCLQ